MDLKCDESKVKKIFDEGVFSLKNGEVDRALNSFMKVLCYWPGCAEAYNNVGSIYFNSLNFERALQCFLKSLEICQGNSRFMHNIGMCYGKLNNLEKAAEYYRKAINHDSNYVHSYYNLAGIYRDIGSYEKSLPLYEQVVSFDGELSSDAKYMISSIRGENIDSAPKDYLTRLFEQYSSYYDEHMYNYLSYNSVIKFGEILSKIDRRYKKSLDIGSGTGEVGKFLKKRSELTIGIDLSESMVNESCKKGYYNECIVGDFLDPNKLPETNSYDCITLCDVMIYYGKCEPVFKKIAKLLSPNGDLIANFEDGEVDEHKLDVTGRFIHNVKHVLEKMEENNLSCQDTFKSYSRIELDKKVSSVFIHARKRD